LQSATTASIPSRFCWSKAPTSRTRFPMARRRSAWPS
jgi:hypothetical protein